MIQIGTANNPGQFSPDWIGSGLAITNYSSLNLAVRDLILIAESEPPSATGGPNASFATLDTETGTVTTYTSDQLNGIVEIREELGYVENETSLRELLEDQADAADLMALLPQLLAHESVRMVNTDGESFLFQLRPRGATYQE